MSSSTIQINQIPISVNKKFLNANEAYLFMIKGNFFIFNALLISKLPSTFNTFLLIIYATKKKKNLQKKIFSL